MASVNSYLVQAHASTAYAASAGFILGHEWISRPVLYSNEDRVATFTNKVTQKASDIVIVGTVSPHMLHCGPAGNFSPFRRLQDSKFTLHLERPQHPCFAHDFDIAMMQISHAQDVVSPDVNAIGLLVDGGIDLSAKIFSKKVCVCVSSREEKN